MHCLLFRCIKIWMNDSAINPSIKIIVIYYLDSNLFLEICLSGAVVWCG